MWVLPRLGRGPAQLDRLTVKSFSQSFINTSLHLEAILVPFVCLVVGGKKRTFVGAYQTGREKECYPSPSLPPVPLILTLHCLKSRDYSLLN